MLEAIFTDGIEEVTVSGLTQWDVGQELKITHSSLPTSFEVHFANKGAEIAYVVEATAASGVSTVQIPNIVLVNPNDATAWIYVSTEENVGETIAAINLPIRKRAKPADYVYTESELKIIDYTALNERVDKLSEEIANLSLGKHTDGLVYIFVNGKPVGNGLNISGGTVGDSDNIALSDGVLTILSLANEPALADSVLSIA